jgi:hypothetical protein
MDLPDLFNLALLCIAIYVWLYGGRAGKIGSLLVLGATFVTYVGLSKPNTFHNFNIVIFCGDLLLFGGFLCLSLKSSRWWPIWAAALQMNGVCSHLVALFGPGVVGDVYYNMATAWGVPILIVMAIGTALDYRTSARRT